MSHLSSDLFDPDLASDLADGSDFAASRSMSEDEDLDSLTAAAAFFASAIHSARNLIIFLWKTTTAVMTARRQMMMATMASLPDMVDGSFGDGLLMLLVSVGLACDAISRGFEVRTN